ncbi:Homeodomain-like superfamily protein, putative isoform 2 [Theobroma cacao]|uniref:Homeodomain-like superfamily protein, putative isoform 2 n=1 Tax=Theobroma cacao TaxID=3641 RepID=A0A061GGM8_THECC|nr:Homeodomain-like superfamily protein, putative isoform 2 [Theobroma cacao]
MSLCENVQSTEVGSRGHQTAPPVASDGRSKPDDDVEWEAEEEVEDEEDEEEDVDFNPFLKETPSPEASSSLSSEIEGLDGDIVDSRAHTHVTKDVNPSKINAKVQNSDVGDSEHGEEETVMQSTASPELQNTIPLKHDKRKTGSSSQSEREKESQSSTVKDSMVGDLSNATHSQKPVIHLDDAEDDAVCRRTRARYSLASFTLDELEAFLQETDDEDDVQNVDDEEEYRKFLAAVLQGGDGDHQSTQGNENVDDEDEDNDADFEIELEEALESDYDEAALEKTQAEEYQRAGRRPETRQNRRQKASAQYERKLLEQTKRPLRPLLPILPNGPIAPIPTLNGKTCMPETYRSCLPSAAVDGCINGFTPYQIGQLHCLIHEHVQLLIQIFSLCVLDPSRQHIASQLHRLIFEMLHKRDEGVACKSKLYPDTCFKPPYVSSSVPNEVPLLCPTQSTPKTSTFNANGVCFSPNTQMPDAQNIFSPSGRYEHVSSGQLRFSWVPSLNSPGLSILDVAPLNLVGRYMDDVYSAVQEHRQRHLENSCATQYEKEPLFPLPCFPSEVEANNEALRGSALPAGSTVPSSVCQPPPKKTLAATLVEKTKKQSVAVVPKDITKLAQRFFPLFNPVLFPHKPPPVAVANRVLFTDAEDELLALGIMEYNSDWKAIQQRYLPCKSKHQIFVRQKNRCSSKAPENPIKAVRRMKTSPLTAEELQGIQEGLKVYKLDWMSVWKFIVPHRDPSLLPRQWRIALGTQKSYKQDATKKEKRRLYESERRKRKAALTNWQHVSDKEAEEGTHVTEQSNNYVSAVIRPLTGHMQGSPHALNQSQHPYATSHHASNALQPTHPVPNMIWNASKSQIYLRPYRSRKSNNLRLVKLAPDLPPVNLPPSVRVISESALKTNQCGAYTKVSATGDGVVDAGIGNTVSPFSHSAKALANKRHKSNPTRANITSSLSEESGVVKNKSVAEERSTHTDLQMHPLLFQAPEDGQVPYYPLNCGTGASSSFSFFSGNQPQLNLSLFYNPQQTNHSVESLTRSLKMKDSVSISCGIDFHPLLQRTDDTNSELMKSVAQCSPFATRSRPSSPNEKANELDLEIHLSSLSTKENAALSGDAATHHKNSAVSLLNSQNAAETRDTTHSSGNKFVSGARASTIPSKTTGRYMDDTSDQSHLEIVMEQEELSDSDEEFEEHVEFECEEMADSEGEGSGCEQVSEMQDKEAEGSTTRKTVTDEDFNNQQQELSTRCNSQGNICVPEKGTPPFLKLGLTCPRKDASSSWLSLDSSASGRTSRSKPKNEVSTISKGPPTKTLASYRLNRPLKHATPSTRKVTVQEHAIDMAEQLSLGPLSVPTLRKPRKRRANTIANTGSSLGNPKNDAKDSG